MCGCRQSKFKLGRRKNPKLQRHFDVVVSMVSLQHRSLPSSSLRHQGCLISLLACLLSPIGLQLHETDDDRALSVFGVRCPLPLCSGYLPSFFPSLPGRMLCCKCPDLSYGATACLGAVAGVVGHSYAARLGSLGRRGSTARSQPGASRPLEVNTPSTTNLHHHRATLVQ